MKNKLFGWAIDEVIELLRSVEKNNGQRLISVFEEFATLHRRKTMSVRNYYYFLLQQIQKDYALKLYIESFGVKIPDGDTRRFDKITERDLLLKVLDYSQPRSVRAVCMDLANGDKKLFVRLQNKYRNLIKHNKPMVDSVIEELVQNNIPVRAIASNVESGNILSMPVIKQSKPLRDDEIQALFWGLVRLVKRTAEEEVSLNLKREAEFANSTLQKTLVDTRRKDMLITELKTQNKKIRDELERTKLKLASEVSKNLKNFLTLNDLVKSRKMVELRDFLAKINPSMVQNTE